jgi:hypothetical protein
MRRRGITKGDRSKELIWRLPQQSWRPAAAGSF